MHVPSADMTCALVQLEGIEGVTSRVEGFALQCHVSFVHRRSTLSTYNSNHDTQVQTSYMPKILHFEDALCYNQMPWYSTKFIDIHRLYFLDINLTYTSVSLRWRATVQKRHGEN